MKNDRLKGYLDAIVLSILMDGDSYGYEISQRVNEQTDGALTLKEGSLYPALKRLEAERFIVGYWGDEKDSGPRRKYYTITENGRGYLRQIESEWNQQHRILSLFFRKVAPQ